MRGPWERCEVDPSLAERFAALGPSAGMWRALDGEGRETRRITMGMRELASVVPPVSTGWTAAHVDAMLVDAAERELRGRP